MSFWQTANTAENTVVGDPPGEHLAVLYWGEYDGRPWNASPCSDGEGVGCGRPFCTDGYTYVYDDVVHGSGSLLAAPLPGSKGYGR